MKKVTPFPFLFIGLLSLLAAMWAGLSRLGWGWPVLQPALPMSHGPLLVSGFLGTVIGLERAVALSSSLTVEQGHRWTYLGPILTGLGALSLIMGLPDPLGPALMTLGSLSLVAVFGLILRIQLAPYTLTMAAGALLWGVGNSLWLLGWPIYSVVSWWMGFLILTIAGERLELGRILRHSNLIQAIFGIIIGVFLSGLLLSLFNLDGGARLTGVAMAALALWLLRYDVARYTVRKSGLTRFMALCLLTGYGWLGLSGLLSLSFGGVVAGFHYDAILHAVFVGFVMSMIFAHAPIIFPAITGKPIPFRAVFYLHLALLHLSLLLRVGSDLIYWLPGRQWGGLLNVVAILLFMVNTLLAMRTANQTSTQGATVRVI
jgi:hypothetical protein